MTTDNALRIEDSLAWRFAAEGRLDPSAPVAASGNIEIARAPEVVWRLLHDVTNWPDIRADVQDVVVLDGGAFTWSAGPIPVRSRFALTEPGRTLTWCTLAAGLEAVHIYHFEAVGSGTRLNAAESMSGPLAGPAISSAQLQSQIVSWLEGVKALAEAR
ncbi:SRPBCC family protein [Devosia sp. LjRoot16]|uniref:SRPBCC family protein n=1 Tax=Devosia sp. LjRoot16 TaxID=3342271 RepID=UPI003ECCF891